ncbi:hypothetical protein [Clostridium beijerinckii]|nr:hypothetical protein [Clostridium beijerinckii]CUU46051.1 protein of unknown function [Clostridium beijerinckii]
MDVRVQVPSPAPIFRYGSLINKGLPFFITYIFESVVLKSSFVEFAILVT